MLSEEMIKIFEYLGDKFGIAIDWTNQNIMPYMQDLLQRIRIYNIANNVYGIIAGIIMLIVAYILFKKVKKETEEEYPEEFIIVFGSAGTTILLILGIAFIFINISGLIQNIYLPEKAILEMIRNIN